MVLVAAVPAVAAVELAPTAKVYRSPAATPSPVAPVVKPAVEVPELVSNDSVGSAMPRVHLNVSEMGAVGDAAVVWNDS